MTARDAKDPEQKTNDQLGTPIGLYVIVDISDHFRASMKESIRGYEMERLRNWMSVAYEFGEQCGPHGIHMVDFPSALRPKLPKDWKIFYCFNEITNEQCAADITLLGADKGVKRAWDKVKSAAAEAAYVAGRFTDGVFTISGK